MPKHLAQVVLKLNIFHSDTKCISNRDEFSWERTFNSKQGIRFVSFTLKTSAGSENRTVLYALEETTPQIVLVRFTGFNLYCDPTI